MFDLNKALNEIGEILFGIRYTGKEQAITINNQPVKDFEPKLIKIGDDKVRDAIGFKLFGSDYPGILNRREPAWIDAEWQKVKRFDSEILKLKK